MMVGQSRAAFSSSSFYCYIKNCYSLSLFLSFISCTARFALSITVPLSFWFFRRLFDTHLHTFSVSLSLCLSLDQ